MTLRELLPSLSVVGGDSATMWPHDIHRHHGRMCVRCDHRTGDCEDFLDDLCDRHGDAVCVRVGTTALAVSRVLSVDVHRGLLRVVTAGRATGVAATAVRLASRHSLARPTPACLCTTSSGCVCPALDLPSDVHAGDVLALVTRCGAPPLQAPTVELSRG